MDPTLDREPEAIGSDLTDAQLAKLEQVSLVWSQTFAAHPSIDPTGYAALRFVEKKYGKAKVREVFDYCIDKHISPQGDSAIPLVIALCKTLGGRHG